MEASLVNAEIGKVARGPKLPVKWIFQVPDNRLTWSYHMIYALVQMPTER